jgi:N-acetylglucosamine malate deacetylase 2
MATAHRPTSSRPPDPEGPPRTALPPYRRLAAVCAHPDDETFGLGAVISTLVDAGAAVRIVCLTRGEASTLGAEADLGPRRARELHEAARILGAGPVTLGSHPDGRLATVALPRLVDDICAAATGVEALLTFDHGGVTGHPDHQHATDAAVAAAHRLGVPVLAWALPEHAVAALNAELDVAFIGRRDDELDYRLVVDRTRQLRAMACHDSQLTGNPVPYRRLHHQGGHEHLRYLAHPDSSAADPATQG